MGVGRRAARRVCLAAAAVCAILSITAPAIAQDADEAGAIPEVFRGAASSAVASVALDREALLPVPGVFRFIAVEGSSVYETDLQTSRASLFYPGNGAMQGPNLVCGVAGGGFPPEFAPIFDACSKYEFPLTVFADGTRPSRSTSGAVTLGAPTDPVSADAIGARANATPRAATSYAALGDLRVLGIPGIGPIPMPPQDELQLDSSVVVIENAVSRTTQRIARGVLTVESTAVLQGVKLIGGLIEIAEIRSRSIATDDATATRSADSAIQISGVTVAGVPAKITEDGLVLGDSGSGPIQQQVELAVNQLLEQLNARVTLLDNEQTMNDGTGQAVASAGGILVEFAFDAQGLPSVPAPPPIHNADPNGRYVGSVQLGNTAASAGATNFPDIDVPPIDFEPEAPVDVPVDDLGGPIVSDGAVDLPVDDGSSGPSSSGDGEGQPQRLVRATVDLFGGRMGFLYLAFALAVVGLAIAPPLVFPARFGGPGS